MSIYVVNFQVDSFQVRYRLNENDNDCYTLLHYENMIDSIRCKYITTEAYLERSFCQTLKKTIFTSIIVRVLYSETIAQSYRYYLRR